MHNYNIISSNFYRQLLELKKETTESIEIEISGFVPEILKEWPDARACKLADIRHNKSDLKKGSRKDKYLLAEYILTH